MTSNDRILESHVSPTLKSLKLYSNIVLLSHSLIVERQKKVYFDETLPVIWTDNQFITCRLRYCTLSGEIFALLMPCMGNLPAGIIPQKLN